tara:strand:+ start:631 stop:957 length:327 start_codon:yes stop_codon:yes gene_type:complete
MARLEKRYKQVEKQVTRTVICKEPDGFNLRLNIREVLVLKEILLNVGGSSSGSCRKYAQEISVEMQSLSLPLRVDRQSNLLLEPYSNPLVFADDSLEILESIVECITQ